MVFLQKIRRENTLPDGKMFSRWGWNERRTEAARRIEGKSYLIAWREN
jgi:hypothetical protein